VAQLVRVPAGLDVLAVDVGDRGGHAVVPRNRANIARRRCRHGRCALPGWLAPGADAATPEVLGPRMTTRRRSKLLGATLFGTSGFVSPIFSRAMAADGPAAPAAQVPPGRDRPSGEGGADRLVPQVIDGLSRSQERQVLQFVHRPSSLLSTPPKTLYRCRSRCNLLMGYDGVEGWSND
jgi:hypothetical protein